MQRDDMVYLGHMLETAGKVAVRVEKKTKAQHDADEDLRYVIAHLIQTIGEAAVKSQILRNWPIRKSRGRTLPEFATASFTITWGWTTISYGRLPDVIFQHSSSRWKR